MACVHQNNNADEKHTAASRYGHHSTHTRQQLMQSASGSAAVDTHAAATTTFLPPHRQRDIAESYHTVDNGENDEFPLPAEPVPLPRLSNARSNSESSGSGPISPASEQSFVVSKSGPMSSNIVVPQRPKPGRKPIAHEDAADRRRTQNRVAQRAFRDKRQQKLQDTLKELTEMTKRYEELQHEIARQEVRFGNRLSKLEQERDATQRRAERAEQRAEMAEKRTQMQAQQLSANAQSSGNLGGFRAAPVTTPTPPYSSDMNINQDEMETETDFTRYGRPNNVSSVLLPPYSNESNGMDYSMERSEDLCGFCVDSQNCVCLQKSEAEAKAAAPPASSVSLPGSCDMCRADPVRAQACRDMASKTEMATQPPMTAAQSASAAMPPPKSYSCSTMINEFTRHGERPSTISTLFGRPLHTYPAREGRGYEFEEKEAAEVLSTLSRRSTVESPRRTDSSA